MAYINIRQILDDLLADDMMKNLSLERAVNYAVEFIRIVGMPNAFEEKTAKIEIHKYRGLLPCNYIEMIQVRECKKGPAMVYSLSSFEDHNRYTYKIQGNVIFTSIEEGEIEISYRAIKVDKDGFPLIVDNGSFARALELYIQKRWFTILFNSGKISPAILQNVQQEYAFYVGQASNDLVRLSLDQMESFKNMWCTLIPKFNLHRDAFKEESVPEILKF